MRNRLQLKESCRVWSSQVQSGRVSTRQLKVYPRRFPGSSPGRGNRVMSRLVSSSRVASGRVLSGPVTSWFVESCQHLSTQLKVSKMSDDKPHISTTQINMFYACAEQWRRRYLEGEIRPPRISMLVGTALHVGAETNWRQKIESRRDLPVAEIVDAAVAGFEQRKAEDGYELDSVECRRGGSVVLGEAVDTVADLAKVHAKRQAPEYQPTEVETRTTIHLDEASHDILAVTDLRTEDGQVVDLKTTRRKMAQSAVDTSLQLTTYYAAYCVDHDRPPESVAFDVLTIGSKAIDRHKLESKRDASDLSALANRVNMMLHAMAQGVFLPTTPDDWRCTPAWCGYYETCPYVSKRK